MKIVMAVALQFLFIWIACVCQLWGPPTFPSIKPYPDGTQTGVHRPLVDEWRWHWLNAWYGNSEDGVSGQQAWVWDSGKLVPYTSWFPAWAPKWWIALCWNWRNNANNLKRPLRDDGLTGVVQ